MSKTAHKAAVKSETAAAYKIPSSPQNKGKISKRGIKKITCLVIDRKIPFKGFPIDVKKVVLIGCKKLTMLPKRKILKILTPKSMKA